MQLDTVMTDLRAAFTNTPRPTSAAGQPTAQKSSPRVRLSRVLPEYACLIRCTDLGINVAAALPPSFTWGVNARYDAPFKDAISSVTNSSVVGRVGAGLASASGLAAVSQTLTAKFWSGSDSGSITLPLVLQAETNEVNDVLRPYSELLSLVVPRTLGDKSGSLLQAPGPHFDLVKAASSAASGAVATVERAGQKTISQLAQSGLDAFSSIKGQIQSIVNSTPAAAANTVLNGVSGGMSAALNNLDAFARNNVVNSISLQLGRFMLFNNVVITAVNADIDTLPVGAAYGYSTGNVARIELSLTFEPFFDIVQRDLATIFLDPELRKHMEALINRNPKAKF